MPAPLFFDRWLGLVENGFEGASGQFASLGQGHGFGLSEYLSVRRRLTGLAQLTDKGERLFDGQSFYGVGQTECAGLHNNLE